MMNFYKNTLVDHQQMVINDNTTYRSSVLLTQITEILKRDEGNEQEHIPTNNNLKQSLTKSPTLLHHIYGSYRQGATAL
jgi:hypothetical protein